MTTSVLFAMVYAAVASCLVLSAVKCVAKLHDLRGY